MKQNEHAMMWSAMEDDILLKSVAEYGTSWKTIVNKFTRREVSSIRNRYQRIMKADISKAKNRCKVCGMKKLGHICRPVCSPSPLTPPSPPSPLTPPPPKKEEEEQVMWWQYELATPPLVRACGFVF